MQDISNTLWAFAALRHHPGADLMDRAASQAIMTIQRFKPQELANTLWSFAMLEHDPSTPLLDTMAIQVVAKIQGFRPQVLLQNHPPNASFNRQARYFVKATISPPVLMRQPLWLRAS